MTRDSSTLNRIPSAENCTRALEANPMQRRIRNSCLAELETASSVGMAQQCKALQLLWGKLGLMSEVRLLDINADRTYHEDSTEPKFVKRRKHVSTRESLTQRRLKQVARAMVGRPQTDLEMLALGINVLLPKTDSRRRCQSEGKLEK